MLTDSSRPGWCRRRVPQDPSKLGGLKGGKARAEKLTKEARFKSARKAAKARWEKKRQQEESS